MEGTGDEPLSPDISLFQRTNGGAYRDAYVRGYLVHAIVLLPVVRCDGAMRLVAGVAVFAEANLCRSCPVGITATHTRCPAPADRRRFRLLDIFSEATRALLPDYHRHGAGGCPALGIPLPARQIRAAGCMATIDVHCRLSPDRHLRFGGNPADGHLVVAPRSP